MPGQRKLRTRLSLTEECEIKRPKMFDILQQNIIESFDKVTQIEFEAYLLEDIEMLMDQFFPDQL